MNHLKEQCDIDYEDKVQEITAARTPIKNNRSVCVTCNQTFLLKNWLKTYIQEEHTQLWCNYCGKMFKNRKEVDNHMYEACGSTCHECTSKDQVENDKEDIVVENEELVIKKDVENRETIRKNMKISSPQYESEL